MSRAYLEVVDRVAAEPVCLLGGWGVYYTVAEAYRRLFRRDYAFSRDIDVGFRLDPGWGKEELAESAMARTMAALKLEEFVGEGFRLRRDFTYDEQRPLTPAEAKKHPLHDLVPLYVDLMVDRPHPLAKAVFGFEPPEELELQAVFEATTFGKGPRFGKRLVVAPRESLLRMKMNALPGRTKSHKIHKDLADIFALVATYNGRRDVLRSEVGRPDLVAGVLNATATFKEDDWSAVTSFTGVAAETIRPLLRSLAK